MGRKIVLGFNRYLVSPLVGSIAILISLDTPSVSDFALYTGAFAILCLSLSALITFITDQSEKDYTFSSESQYIEKMCQIYGSAEEVLIITRELKWVKKDSKIWNILKSKAKKGGLTIYMEEATAISSGLARHGAKVYYFKQTGFQIFGGFSIIGDVLGAHKVIMGSLIFDDPRRGEYRRLHQYPATAQPAIVAKSAYFFLKDKAVKHV